MSETILPKPYNHTKQNIWEACGLDPEEMNALIETLGPELDKMKSSSCMIEMIENLEQLNTRQKTAMAYYVVGIQASNHFDRTMKEMTAMVAKQISIYKQEIKRLGGSANIDQFGEKPINKRRRPSNNRKKTT